ncbi:hypothetical protein FACS1894158_08590 [Betaproteobacteria bacterium]|nr:hypothetical protein FACS1894158_08590 [Betaproteobacteria bacterium]
MCKELKIILIFILALCLNEVAISEVGLIFPLHANGISALKEIVSRNRENHAIHYQIIKIKKGIDIVIVNHNSGSGVIINDAYVYACTENECRMLSMRHAFKEGLLAELTSDEKELILKSEKGVVYLQMPFNWPRSPKD